MTAPRAGRSVLAFNVGSASLKAAHYVLPLEAADVPAMPQETGRVSIEAGHDAVPSAAPAQLAALLARLPEARKAPDVVLHRIVHGGEREAPTALTPAELTALESLSVLAPLHQPPALALVRATAERWPRAEQIGVYDTAWHRTMPERHRLLPLPYPLFAQGVQRYGFHGLAFQSAMRQLAGLAPDRCRGRVVLAHLGGGSSLCAVRDGRCVNTTMGMTPLDGIPMATRPGSLDPGVVLYLQRNLGMPADDLDRLLWRESGLSGLSGESGDMHRLLASPSPGAQRAVEVYVTRVAQGIAAMAACIGGIELLAFSGGIGRHAAEIRSRVAAELEWLGVALDPALNREGVAEVSSATATVRTFVLAVDEEREMALAYAARTP
ncbi:acetate/propionate family kinase [Vulcaniibacterium gelatinicum]|uniref:acetate/propionate family kinase n=1 Tax=Vulcaniibacterium gelatinicum TaxID=2598725 RepID=UPI0011C8D4AD|nr:acetate/propionate family kinase [Vulcaniibacterium gelatinicum]